MAKKIESSTGSIRLPEDWIKEEDLGKFKKVKLKVQVPDGDKILEDSITIQLYKDYPHHIALTQEEYDKLSNDAINRDTVYFIKD